MSEHLLPEWHAQDAVLLAWPHDDTDWQATIHAIQGVYTAIIAAITRFERIVLLVHNEHVLAQARSCLSAQQIAMENILFVQVAYDDTWLRDSGPLTSRSETGVSFHDFRFNGWGGKFSAKLDDQVCERLFAAGILNADYQHHTIILEGGSIDSDGAGTLLTTRRCLLSSTRNPGLTETDYAGLFKSCFGINRIHWLDHGEILGDDTDGHIDMLARFCDRHTIAYTSCNDQSDPHFEPLQKLQEELQALRQANGEPYRLVPLPLPDAIYNETGHRLPASYANFLIINQAVLVPVYDDPMDEHNCQLLAECFPDRTIIPVSARAIIQQGGSLHCLTMQLPTGLLASS